LFVLVLTVLACTKRGALCGVHVACGGASTRDNTRPGCAATTRHH